MDILHKHHMENEIFAFLFDEAKTQKIFLADDNGIAFYIRDTVDEKGERIFLMIHYHSFTEKLNKELKVVLKNFSKLGECYGAAECSDYYFVSINPLSENRDLINAAAPIIHKHLPEGVCWKFIRFKEGTNIENELKNNDYERLF
jgi:hypothetical protein